MCRGGGILYGAWLTFTVIDADMKLIRLLRMRNRLRKREIADENPIEVLNQYFALFRSKTDIFWICARFCWHCSGFPNQFFDAPFWSSSGLRAAQFSAHAPHPFGKHAAPAGLQKFFRRRCSFSTGFICRFAMLAICPFPLAFLPARFYRFRYHKPKWAVFSFRLDPERSFPMATCFSSLGIVWYFSGISVCSVCGLSWLPCRRTCDLAIATADL